MPRSAFLAAALIAAATAPLHAQQYQPYGPVEGNRVRVVAPALAEAPIIGVLTALGGDSLVMRSSSGRATMRLPADKLQQVEVSEGHARYVSALRYGAVGAVVGSVWASATIGDDPLGRMAAFFAGGILGIPIGAATGAIIAPEEWRIAWRPDAAPPAGSFRLAVDEGTALRYALRADTARTLRGQAGGIVSDTLLLLPRGGSPRLAVPLRDLSRLEISGGDDKRKGMMIGAAIVGGATAVFAGVDASKGAISAGDAVGTVAVNALLGALVGYAFAPAGWERLPLPPR